MYETSRIKSFSREIIAPRHLTTHEENCDGAVIRFIDDYSAIVGIVPRLVRDLALFQVWESAIPIIVARSPQKNLCQVSKACSHTLEPPPQYRAADCGASKVFVNCEDLR